MAPNTKANTSGVILIQPVRQNTLEVALLGLSPLIQHRMAAKGLRELLFPAPPRNRAEKAATLKHDPLWEFADAAMILPTGPTLLGMPSTAFKKALMTAALDMPGSTKSQIGRLVYVEDEHTGIYGIPHIFSTVVRNSGLNRTPDVRTRPILPHWAAVIRITYVTPLITEQGVLNLLTGAGTTAGVGDFRPEKGAGAFGRFCPVRKDDPEFLAIMEQGGRAAQESAMADPEPYDDTTRELLGWFADERKRRGPEVLAA